VLRGLRRQTWRSDGREPALGTRPNFERLHRAARQVGDARSQIEFTDGEIDWRERELLTDRKLSDRRRGELRAEIRSLERERGRARDDRWEAELALDRVRRDLGI
jgi:hypothetical protein